MAAEGEGGGPEADSDLGDLCPEARPYLHLRDRVPESRWSGRPSQDGREGEREGRPGGEGQRDRGTEGARVRAFWAQRMSSMRKSLKIE